MVKKLPPVKFHGLVTKNGRDLVTSTKCKISFIVSVSALSVANSRPAMKAIRKVLISKILGQYLIKISLDLVTEKFDT